MESRFNIKYSKLKNKLLSELPVNSMFRFRISYLYLLKLIWWALTFLSLMIVNNWKLSAVMKRLELVKFTFLAWLIDRLTFMLQVMIEWKQMDQYFCSQRQSTKINYINKSMILKYHKNQTIFDWSINFSLLSIYQLLEQGLKSDWHPKLIWNWISCLNLFWIWVPENLHLITSRISSRLIKISKDQHGNKKLKKIQNFTVSLSQKWKSIWAKNDTYITYRVLYMS